MKATFTTRNRKSLVEAAFIAFPLAALFYMLHREPSQECHLVHNTAWLAFKLLRPALSAVWQSVPAHLCEGSSFLHLLQIVASIWQPLCVLVG